MHAIVSVLEPEYYQRVEALWGELQDRFGISGARITPIPHFSWQIASDYDFDQIEHSLNAVAETVSPFVVTTDGIGVFAGNAPVVYIKIQRTEQLDRLHACLWNASQPYRHGESPYYSPGNWVPHVTLAERDVRPDTLVDIKEYLSGMAFRWQVTVSNLALIYQPDGSTGTLIFTKPLKFPSKS